MAYVIAQPAGTKRARLYRTRRSGDRLLGVVPDHTQYTDPAAVTIRSSEIVVSLGDDPPYGSVYGVLVEPVEERLLIPRYGQVYNFVHKMHDSVKTRVTRALPEALSRVKAMGPACDWEVRTEIRNMRGTVGGGTYCYRPRDEEDVLVLRPVEGMGTKELVKVLAHEWAHGVWFRHMDSVQRSVWITLFDRYVRVTEVSVRDIRAMLRDMRQIEGVRPYMKDAEPEQQAAATMYLGWLKNVHSLKEREANDLITSGGEAPVPDTHLHRSETQTPITLYSKQTAPELFAEALSSQAVGDLADRRIQRLLGALRDRPASPRRERRERES